MPIRVLRLSLCLSFAAVMAFGQVGNGTITGVLTDPTGAVIAGTAVEAKNTETGVVFRGVSTTTGDYTITDLPVGTYALTVAARASNYTRANLALAATQTLREDIYSPSGILSRVRDRHTAEASRY